jgi:uncharacterized membrane protein
MDTWRKALLGTSAVTLFFFGQLAYYYPRLPEKVASHFGANGIADGWMPKNEFVMTTVVTFLFTLGILLGSALLISKLPAETLNMPNKEYWLAPERKTETIAFMGGQMLWFSAATALLLVAIFQMTYQANRMPTPRLGGESWIYLVSYLAFTLFWTIGLVRRFRLPG